MRRLAVVFALAVTACGGPPVSEIKSRYVESVVADAGRAALQNGRRGHRVTGLYTRVASTDAYANTTYNPGPVFLWYSGDLNKVNWPEANAHTVMDLADVTWPLGEDRGATVEAMSDWCEGNTELYLTPNLCRRWRALVAKGI